MSSPEVQQVWTRTDVYHNSFLLPNDEVLDNVVENSRANHMLEIAVSPAQGKFLHLLASSIGAKKILEIGTLGGLVDLLPLTNMFLTSSSLTSTCRYSTTWLARAVPEDGTVTTLDLDPRCVKVATENLTTAGLIHKVNVILGPAAQTLETLSPTPTPFDLVFIDADKEGNTTYFKHAKRLLRKGGVIVCVFQDRWNVRSALITRISRSSTTLFAMATFLTQRIRIARSKGCEGFWKCSRRTQRLALLPSRPWARRAMTALPTYSNFEYALSARP